MNLTEKWTIRRKMISLNLFFLRPIPRKKKIVCSKKRLNQEGNAPTYSLMHTDYASSPQGI